MNYFRFSTEVYKITSVHKKTKAKGFELVKVGDRLECAIYLKRTVNPRGGLYASDIEITHLRKIERGHFEIFDIWRNSQNTFLNNISKFDLETVC